MISRLFSSFELSCLNIHLRRVEEKYMKKNNFPLELKNAVNNLGSLRPPWNEYPAKAWKVNRHIA